MADIVFVTPVEARYLSDTHPFYRRVPYYVGTTVLKEDGVYRQVVGDVLPEEIDAADMVYLGGHEYVVDENEAAELIAAGYGIYIKYSGFGSGFYGMGYYGIPQEGVSNG